MRCKTCVGVFIGPTAKKFDVIHGVRGGGPRGKKQWGEMGTGVKERRRGKKRAPVPVQFTTKMGGGPSRNQGYHDREETMKGGKKSQKTPNPIERATNRQPPYACRKKTRIVNTKKAGAIARETKNSRWTQQDVVQGTVRVQSKRILLVQGGRGSKAHFREKSGGR